MVTPEQAAVLFHLSTRQIHHMVDEGTVHFVEMSDGLLMICLKSLTF